MRISDWSSDVCSSDLDLSVERLAERLGKTRKSESLSNQLRKAAGLNPLAINLLREAHEPLPRDAQGLAAPIKRVPLRSEERRVGKECVRTCRSRCTQYH